VLLDLGLPGMDGYQVAERLRKPGVKLVAMTGHGDARDIEHCQEAGFDLRLLKPVSADQLRQALSD